MRNCGLFEICAAVGGTLLQGADLSVQDVTIDSRTARSGELYIALVGERTDGHRYVEAALTAGAAAAVVSQMPEKLMSGKGYILVPDTQEALKALATWYRRQFNIPFVQVTGSAGKTTTKEMIASVLSRHYRTLRTEGNLNNHVGTPLMLLRLRPEHEMAVIETGMSHFGEIRYMGEMVQPDVAVITNVGDAHMGNLDGTRRGVLQAKCEIFENLRPNGIAVLNGDDELLRDIALHQETVFCGKREGCHVRISDVTERGINGTDCTVTTAGDVYRLHIASPGGYMVYPAAMAIAIAERMGLDHREIVEGIADYRSVGSRMRVVRMPGERIIIDDCYNANPQAMAEALRLLSLTDCRRRIAVLGDMGELGIGSEQAHRRLGNLAGSCGLNALITIGEQAKWIAEAAGGGAQWFPTIADATEALRRLFTPGTAVLVKASHSMGFTQVVEELEKVQ
ncbi:MAG: UDP-N-acetylmuramoyl-tripeptide--D-alanyl-D-alanine ligase [Oscillospiraceae bacterium]|nr:UDP-N-acetylmuramoyl-tripeptide--D-alanyl-D-alanine ligase [Oscillospiraceae bacterium]